jgi:hypothetical protein
VREFLRDFFSNLTGGFAIGVGLALAGALDRRRRRRSDGSAPAAVETDF